MPRPDRPRRADPRRLLGLVAVAAAALLPVAIPAKAFAIAVVLVKTTGAMSLSTLVGQAGQMSLGQGAFVGVGAFVALNLASRHAPLPVAVLGAVAAGALVAAVTGLPSLRIRGLQVAVTTLAFGVMAEKFLFGQQWFSGGAGGIGVDRPVPFESDRAVYYLAFGALALAYWVDVRVRGTKAGRAFVAVRDGEPRAPSFGVEPGQAKLLAYTVSGAVAGLAGAMFTYVVGRATPSSFNIYLSLNLVVIVIVGGVGSRIGVLASSTFLLALPELLPKTIGSLNLDPGRRAPLIAAWMLVVILRALPGGLGQLLERIGNRLFGARSGAAVEMGADASAVRPEQVATRAKEARFLRRVPRPLSLRMPSPAHLDASGVSVRFGGVQALDAVDLEVRRGEIVGLIGANGAGKTTFFNAVGGFVPAAGSVRFKGREVLASAGSSRPRFGVARTWQQMGLLTAETVEQNLLLAQHWIASYPAGVGILGFGGTPGTERQLRRRARAALAIFGLEDLAGHRVGDLPYGVMRRCEIAAAVAAGPDLLMLDEASAGLAPEEARALGDQFMALRAELGLTLLVIEHHVPLIARVTDYLYCLESGRLIAHGPPARVTSDPKVVESFMGRSGVAPTASAVVTPRVAR
ncbi:MAG: branched-chain amino acid ABC transporter ATP-binding protein/permease [Acidobacteria bacterium]|nr:branched-chain amino acid ABC transporter ATP-binding protein/permease [Acidobacteriota bacterium]